jgi:2'-5' RNA ligase
MGARERRDDRDALVVRSRLGADDAELSVETALVITLEDADPFDEVRREFAVETFALGIPFHVTLLYPFAPREELTAALLADVRSFFAERKPFELELTRVAMWPRVVYAVPEPAARLREIMRALFERFPQWPPYEGIHEEVVPHATLGEEIEAAQVYAEIEKRVAPHLPARYLVDEASLLEEFAPDRWRERERFPLSG